jgi:type IV secretory pathway protease TraF
VLPVALLAGWLLPQITLVMSPSIDAFALRKAPGIIARGDYVMLMVTSAHTGPRPVSITKYALCLPGDRLITVETMTRRDPAISTGHYYCNDELLGSSLARDRTGHGLDHFRWNGLIPPGHFYVGSHHPRGFDSRYFGLVPLGSLTRMERLL